jgi:hypothetical protein
MACPDALFLMLLSAALLAANVSAAARNESESYSGKVVMPNLEARLGVLVKKPFESLGLSIPMVELGFLNASDPAPAQTEAIREWVYNQVS